MRRIRIGTRGSELARRQTDIVIAALHLAHPGLQCDVIVIRTEGDLHPDRAIGEGWPLGSFTSAIERALLEGRIDLAVHSMKDLPTTETAGLTIAAVLSREAPHDVLVTANRVELERLPPGLRFGTSSPRRAAQLRHFLGSGSDMSVVPIRGNVPTRLAKVGRDGLDGVVLAAAGLRRLAIVPECVIDLPLNRFLPAPGQGALALQVRSDDQSARATAAAIDDAATHMAVIAERAFLAQIGAGCQTPVAGLATVGRDDITLRGQLFSEDGTSMVMDERRGREAQDLGRELALELRARLGRAP